MTDVESTPTGLLSLAGKTFVVSGAGGGIGRYLAPALIGRGASLILVGRDTAKLDAVAAAVGAPERLQTVVGDVMSPDAGAAAVSSAIDRFGCLNGLVHLVGGFHAGTPAALTPLGVYEQQLQVNFLSAVAMTPPVLAQLKEGGVLLYLSSLLATEPRPTTGAYAASKAALTSWVRGLQQEIAPRRIRANVVSTTIVNTGSVNGPPPGLGVPVESIVEALAFLASDAARDVYGATLPVCGSQPPGSGGPPAGNAQVRRTMDTPLSQTA
jgi:NAD(P)-dependent dehydrogenase (short-subunit alcohol dehydrogenase family)